MTSTQAIRSAKLRATLFRIVLVVPGFLVLLYDLVISFTPGLEPALAPDEFTPASILLEFAIYLVAVVAGLALYPLGTKITTWQLIRWWLPVNIVMVGAHILGWWYQTETSVTAGVAAYCVALVLIGGRTRSYGQVVIYAMSLAGVAFVPFLLATEDNYSLLIECTFVAICCAVVAYYWRYLRRSREQINKEVQVAVRQGMARDLHDLVAHEVTGMIVLAKAAAAAPQGETSREALNLIEAAGSRAMKHIRVLVSADDQDERSLPEARLSVELATMLEAFRATTQAQLMVDIESIEDVELPAPVHIAAYKIVSEALTNIRRHAQSADCVRMQAAYDRQSLTLVVRDNGRGGGLGSGTGTGTRSMAERAALVGGSLVVGRDDDDWWTVTATLPLAQMTSLDKTQPRKVK